MSESGADSKKASDESSPSGSQDEDYVQPPKVGAPQGSPSTTRVARQSGTDSDESSLSDSNDEDYVQPPKVGAPQGSPSTTRAARLHRGADELPVRSLPAPKRKKRVAWTEEETAMLVAAVGKYGKSWIQMVQDQAFRFDACRDNVSLKDKWRNLQTQKKKKKA
jgi:hypothetical protein